MFAIVTIGHSDLERVCIGTSKYPEQRNLFSLFPVPSWTPSPDPTTNPPCPRLVRQETRVETGRDDMSPHTRDLRDRNFTGRLCVRRPEEKEARKWVDEIKGNRSQRKSIHTTTYVRTHKVTKDIDSQGFSSPSTDLLKHVVECVSVLT